MQVSIFSHTHVPRRPRSMLNTIHRHHEEITNHLRGWAVGPSLTHYGLLHVTKGAPSISGSVSASVSGSAS